MMHISLGLALGGGGARGFAHIGVLTVFEREKIPIHCIAGTSSGALVGGAYAAGVTPEELRGRMTAYLESDEFQSSAINAVEKANERGDCSMARRIQYYLRNRLWLLQAMFKPGIMTSEDFQRMIDYFIPDIDVSDTIIPFRPVATDLISGERVVFTEGSLRRSVMASCAVPGAIGPLCDGIRCLADGGIVSLVPVTTAREAGADVVVAVSVERPLHTDGPLKTAQEICERANEVTFAHLARHEMKGADIIIHPDVGDMNWADFSRGADVIDKGKDAAIAAVETTRRTIARKRWRCLLRGIVCSSSEKNSG